ncbi:MAG: hypothetical protein QXP84_07475 [Candidatus Korarchaeum sp.]
MGKGLDLLTEVLRYGSRSAVIIGERGKGKSQLIGTLSYSLWKNGWTVIILDPKASFQYANVPNIADPEVAVLVRKYWGDNLNPWDALFFMPYYAWDFNNAMIPDHIEPAPISMRMILSNTRAWELLGDGALKPHEVEMLMKAYQKTGREHSSPTLMLSFLKEEDKLTPRLSDLLFSGIISTTSPIDPNELLLKGKGKVIVLTSPRTVNSAIIAFWYGTFLQSLFATLRDWPEALDVAVFIDETLVLSHGSKQTTSSWWFSKLLSEFLSQGRQVGKYGNVRTRIFTSAQLASAVDYEVLSLTNLGFISPGILLQDAERNYLRRHFCRKISTTDGSVGSDPGEFYVYLREGKLGLMKFPMSPVFIPREYDTRDERSLKQQRFIMNHFNFRSLTPLFTLAKNQQSMTEGMAPPRKIESIAGTYLESRFLKYIGLTLILYGIVLADKEAGGFTGKTVVEYARIYDLVSKELNMLPRSKIDIRAYIRNRTSPSQMIHFKDKLLALGITLSPSYDLVLSDAFVQKVLPRLKQILNTDYVIERCIVRGRGRDVKAIRELYAHSLLMKSGVTEEDKGPTIIRMVDGSEEESEGGEL